MNGVDVPRARRWFKLLVLIAVISMGALSSGISAPAGVGTGILVLLSSMTLALSTLQAVRIWRALSGPLLLRIRPPSTPERWGGE